MAIELPPTDYFTNISFNPDFYQSTSSDYLTASTGKSYFLTYPTSQGSETFTSNVKLQSTLTDASGAVGTSGQVLSSTGSGTSWIASGGITYATYTASATLSLVVDSTLLVIFSGSTASQTLTIPFEYPDGQKIQIKSTASVNVTISTGSVLTFLYGVSASATSFTLIPYDVINLIYSGSAWIQDTPSNTFTKIVGSNGCLAGQTNYVSINTSALPQTVSTTINTDMFVFLVGSTASKVLSIPVVTNTGQMITIKNTASVDVSLAFPSSNVMLFGSLSVVAGPIILKTKGVISLYWGSAFWIQTVPSDALNDLTCDTYNGSSALAATMAIGTNITGQATGVPISIGTSIGTLPPIGISVGGTDTKIKLNGPTTFALGPTITTGGLTISAGNLSLTSASITSAGVITGSSIISTSLNASTDAISMGISTTQTTGVLNIGTGSRAITGLGGAINLGTSSSNAAPINIGGVNTGPSASTSTSTSVLSFNGGRLWSIISGDISFRGTGTATLTSSNNGTVNIATESFSDVNIGTSGSTKITTIYGVVTVAGTGILGGRTSWGTGGATTISATAINQTFTYIINTAGSIVLPAASTQNQVINIRSLVPATNTISSSSNIWPTGTGTFGLTYTLGAYASIILWADGGTWYQLL